MGVAFTSRMPVFSVIKVTAVCAEIQGAFSPLWKSAEENTSVALDMSFV
jgi:hypothetical protein